MVGGAAGSKSKYFFMMAKRGKKDTSASANNRPTAVKSVPANSQKPITSFFGKTKGGDDSEGEPNHKRQKVESNGNVESSSKLAASTRDKLKAFSAIAEDSGDGAVIEQNEENPVDLKESPSSSAGLNLTALKEAKAKVEKFSGKPTPLEKQVLELKQRYPNLILFVECGYRYRFFGDDAEIASKVLGILCHPDRMFMTGSVPTFHGPGTYVRKLVSKGYKVGIVSQTETAAEKQTKNSSSSSGPFARALTAVYTRTTVMGEDISLAVAESMAGNPLHNVKSMILSVRDSGAQVAVVGVQPSTGQIVWDEFDDDIARNELRRRLETLQPLEILVASEELTERTKSTLKYYCDLNSVDECVRLEEVQPCQLTQSDVREKFSLSPISALVHDLPSSVLSCLEIIFRFLSEMGMSASVTCSGNLERFVIEEEPRMKLPAITVRNLEIFRPLAEGGSCKSTLFGAINRTRTKMGARKLKDWISAPLMNIGEIESRQDAVAFLLRQDCGVAQTFRSALHKMVDLEVALVAALCKRIKPSDFVRMCHSMMDVQKAVTSLSDVKEAPSLVKSILEDLSSRFESVEEMLSRLQPEQAKDNKLEELFADWKFAPDVSKRRDEIATLEETLRKHKDEIRSTLGLATFDYVTVGGVEFLVEVKHNLVCKVPDSWGKISNTKQVARFRTPFVVSTLPHLTFAREGLGRECKKAWLAFLDQFNGRFSHYQLGAKRVAELDCLLSLAELAREDGFCRPELLPPDQASAAHLWQARNVVVERLLPAGKQFVPNDIHLGGGEDPSAMILTGPNMGGKSCLLRTVALTSILAQIGSFVPAAQARLSVIDAIYVRTGARDDIFAKKSTLMVEMEEAGFVLATASARSLVLMDELGRGTSTSDGTVIARAVLRFLARSIGCLTIFVTHFKALTADPELRSLAANWHMGYARDSTSGHDAVLMLYQLVEGASESSFGLNVARAAGLPESVLQMAGRIASAAEQQDSLK